MRAQKGFTLMMVSVGIVLISLFAAASVGFRASQSNVDRKQITINKMNTINDALTRFAAVNGRLPCPASPTATSSSSTFGKESRDSSYYLNCNATNMVESSAVFRMYSGAAPTRTLGLPDEYAVDGWGNKIEFVISPFLSKNYNEDTANNYINRDGAIVINNESGTAIDNNAAYVIISRGANGYGAYNAYSSNRNAYPPASLPIERGNMECNNSSCSAAVFDANYQLANSPANSDDILVYKNKTDFINDCFIKTNSPNCLINQCLNSAAPLNWQNAVRTVLNKEEVMVVSSNTTPPSLDLSSLQRARRGNLVLNFKINAMVTTNATIKLSYTYATSAAPNADITTTIATFSTSAAANYTASSIGNFITPINFGVSSGIFKSLQFSISTNGSPSSAYMAISNITISDYDTTLATNAVSSLYWRSLTPDGGRTLSTGFQASRFISYEPDERGLFYPLDSGISTEINSFRKVFGYITPPATGNYTFYLSSDDNATFWLSDGTTSNKLNKISYIYGDGTISNQYQWTTNIGQKSAAVSLTGSKSYYFEIWHKNGWGNGHVELAWTGPNPLSSTTPAVIANTYLSTIPKEHISSPPVCKTFYTTKATLTPAQQAQPADIISLNNTYGRYVKLSLLSNQPTSSGQDPRQDVYYLGEVRFRDPMDTGILPGIFMTSSNLYVDNANMANNQPYQGIGLIDDTSPMTPSTVYGITGDFITNGQYSYNMWITQNTRAPQYVIFDLGSSIQLKDILIWNGNQLFTSGGVTCCPGRSVKDVRVSVSDDPYFLIYHAG